MKKTILLFALISTSCFLNKISYSQIPDWIWVKSAIGSHNDLNPHIAIDASGNIYMAGLFGSPILTFGTTTLINADNTSMSSDIFLVKYDINGNIIWAKSIGGMRNDVASSIAIDTIGNVYLCGQFQSSNIDFDTTTLMNTDTSNTYDLFISKFDTNGNVLWARSAGGIKDESVCSVTVDASGNTYMAGFFYSATIKFDTMVLTNTVAGSTDIFLVKYDAYGNAIWTKSEGGTTYDDVSSIAVDAVGNIYMAGNFQSPSITFGTYTLTNNGSYDIYLVKYNTYGNVLWVKSIEGTSNNYTSSIELDTSGNIYMTGYYYSSTLSIDTTILTNIGGQDIFLVKYDTIGNVLWVKGAGGTSSDFANSIAVDAFGNTYLTGSFAGSTITFGSDTLPNMNTIGYVDEIYIVKYNTYGSVLWAKSVSGMYDDEAHSVAVDISGNIYIAGDFASQSLYFGSIVLINQGAWDIFLAKIDSDFVTGINELNNLLNISVFPNPATDNITIIIPQKALLEIFNAEGQIIKRVIAKNNNTIIDISSFVRGMYFVKVNTGEGIVVKKFVKNDF